MPGSAGTYQYYPLFVRLRGKKVVVVGGGKVAERKARDLEAAGAEVTVVSPGLTPGLKSMVREGKAIHIKEGFSPGHLAGAWLVVAATDDPRTQEAVFTEATSRRIFCNVVDQPELCSFIVPASVRRGELCIAVSTSGNSPALARKIRIGLERSFGPAYSTYVSLIGGLRRLVLDRVPPGAERTRLLTRLADEQVITWVEEGRTDKIEAWVESIAGTDGVDLVRREFAEKSGRSL